MELNDTFKVEITQEDINKGIAGSCNQCPIAQAFMKKFPYYDVAVRETTVVIANERGFFTLSNIDGRQKRFIYAFDHYLKVKPTHFTYQVIPNATNL